MRPTFTPGQHLLVASVRHALSRGDVVVIYESDRGGKRYLKRIVGLPGEEVRLLDGLLYIDGARQDEPYLKGLPSTVGLGERGWKLGHAEFFVMGDDRPRSTDSRAYGPIHAASIAGVVWFRYWPVSKWGRMNS